MGAFTTTYERIIRQPALTMPGNFTGSEAACTAGNASSIRTLLSLATTSDVTFDIIRATTSVQTPLVNNASAALTLGNSTYGVTVPGAMGVGGVTATAGKLHVKQTAGTYNSGIAVAATTNDSFLSMRWDAGDVFVIEPTWESTGAWKPLAIRTNGANRILFGTDGNIGIGTTGTAPLHVYRAGAATSLIESGVSFAELSLSSASGNSSFITSNRNLEFFVGGATRQTINSSTGATTFTGDIIMSKTSAQGYIYAYATNGTSYLRMAQSLTAASIQNNVGRMSLTGAAGISLITTTGDIDLAPASGNVYMAGSGANGTLVVYDADASHSTRLANDGTNGILSTSSGNLQFDLGAAGGYFDFRGVSATNNTVRIFNSLNTISLSLQHTGGYGIIDSSSGVLRLSTANASHGFEFRPKNGYIEHYTPGTNSDFTVWGGNGAAYIALSDNGTDGTLRTVGGNLNLVPTGGTVAVTGGITASGRITGSGGGAYTAILTGDAGSAFIQTKLSGGYTYTFGTEATDRFIIFDQTGGGYKLIIAPTLMTVGTPMSVTGTLTTTGTGSIRANGALCSGAAATNTALGVLDLYAANGTGACVIWSEAGIANRGAFGFAAGSSTLGYRAGGTSMTTGTEVFTITSAGSLTHTGGQQTGYVAKTANYTTTAADHLVNVTANSIDITLETAVGCAGRIHEIINTGSGTVTMKTTSAQTISGSASGALTLAQWKSMTVKSDGANWLIVSQIT